MKKVFIASILLNIVLIGFILFKFFRKPNASNSAQTEYAQGRKSVLDLLPIDSNDIVFIGNSITEGFPVTEFFGPDVKNRGIAGDRVQNVMNRLDQIIKGKPKKVFLMIGINDLKDGMDELDILYGTGTIIEKLQGTKVYVQSVLPTAKKFSYLGARITKFNELLQQYCIKHNISFINLYPSFKNINSLTFDGLHLNGEGYKIWRDCIKQYINH